SQREAERRELRSDVAGRLAFGVDVGRTRVAEAELDAPVRTIEEASGRVRAKATSLEVEQRLQAAQLGLALKDVRRLEGLRVVDESSGDADRKIRRHLIRDAHRRPEHEDAGLVLLAAIARPPGP